jgi:membrane-bound ClpP family serine protease|tara:strand:- start:103 stop:390 length:288 start_codon:yes stop_codon:yes gene_type:complete
MDNIFLFNGNTWLIIGLILIFIELFEGSLVVFLPTGISALIVGIILKLQEGDFIPSILSDWLWTSVLWAFLAVGISVLMRNIFKTKNIDDDINNY